MPEISVVAIPADEILSIANFEGFKDILHF